MNGVSALTVQYFSVEIPLSGGPSYLLSQNMLADFSTLVFLFVVRTLAESLLGNFGVCAYACAILEKQFERK